jgi:hypothetical protein
MKKKCNICNHSCHCYGKGYYLNSNKCDSCICDSCTCTPLVIKEEPKKKSWWQKYVDWLFREYNDDAM